ncbi:hypothetical protein llap_18850 [Limosa lapponica baueri]|uniref:Uncharacterized protein n=1 Tax=Limosa lapponica baueri TaxID=1758121 RepID=A0A2I0TAP0_LIMLA|nr:hypothetical protein llap_18850 [Limosa lapponica baueri]
MPCHKKQKGRAPEAALDTLGGRGPSTSLTVSEEGISDLKEVKEDFSRAAPGITTVPLTFHQSEEEQRVHAAHHLEVPNAGGNGAVSVQCFGKAGRAGHDSVLCHLLSRPNPPKQNLPAVFLCYVTLKLRSTKEGG